MKTAAKFVLSEKLVADLRKDFLLLMKNIGRDLTAHEIEKWDAAIVAWRDRFSLFLRQTRTELEGRSRTMGDAGDQHAGMAKAFLNRFREAHGLVVELTNRPSMTLAKALQQVEESAGSRTYTPEEKQQYAAEKIVYTWQEKGPKFATRTKKAAADCWKYLKELAEWTETTNTPLHVHEPTLEHITLEGFKLEFQGFPEATLDMQELLASFKAGLSVYRARASQVLPLILKLQLPIVVLWEDFGAGDVDIAATYLKNRIELKALGISSKPREMCHVLAHEMTHHIWQTFLTSAAKEAWTSFMQGDLKQLDLREVLKLMRPNESLGDLGSRIERENPILYLQLESLGSNPTYRDSEISTPRQIRDYLDDGGDPMVQVPINPITHYASKSPQEAFCEAVGKLVAWGPRTLPDVVVDLLRRILPNLRVAREASPKRVASVFLNAR